MHGQNYKRYQTPLSERVRYFFEVMFWLLITAIVLVLLLWVFVLVSDILVPRGIYPGNPAYIEDERLCLETRPRDDLYKCLGEYGWFDN